MRPRHLYLGEVLHTLWHGPHRRLTLRNYLCELGLHWPVRWDVAAHPMGYDPPTPPEPDFCCQNCGHVREPYSAWTWEPRRLAYLFFHGEWAER